MPGLRLSKEEGSRIIFFRKSKNQSCRDRSSETSSRPFSIFRDTVFSSAIILWIRPQKASNRSMSLLLVFRLFPGFARDPILADVCPGFVLGRIGVGRQGLLLFPVFLPDPLALVEPTILPDRADLRADAAGVAAPLHELLVHLQAGRLVVVPDDTVLSWFDGILGAALGA